MKIDDLYNLIEVENLGLNFESKEKYETPLQKINIFIIYFIGYLSIPAMLFNVLFRSEIILGYLAQSPPLPIPTQQKVLLLIAYTLLLFSIFNVFFANPFKKKNPYKINKSLISFILINIVILAPFSLIDMSIPFNKVFFAVFIIDAVLVILLIIVYNLRKTKSLQNQSELPSIKNGNPKVPANYIVCPNCMMNVRPDVIYCPICNHKIAR